MTPQSHAVKIVAVCFECSSTHEGPRSSTQAIHPTEQEFTGISEKGQFGEKTKLFATEHFRSWCHSFSMLFIHTLLAAPLKLGDDEVQVSEEVPVVTSVKDSSVSTAAMTEEDCPEPPHVSWQLRSVN